MQLPLQCNRLRSAHEIAFDNVSGTLILALRSDNGIIEVYKHLGRITAQNTSGHTTP